MTRHGLSISTITRIIHQLFNERLTGKYRWKRGPILDRLQWDVFKWFYTRIRPTFSTFFVNSTAHLQHMHWRNMEPDPFKVKPSDSEQQEYQGAILFGYEEMDHIVGDALKLAGDSTVLILASALGQQPCVIYEDIGGKTFYRPRVFEKVLEYAGVTEKFTISPVMAEEFQVLFESVAAGQQAKARLRALRVNGKAALRAEGDGSVLHCGCPIFEKLPDNVLLERDLEPGNWPFFRLFYQVEGLKSGMHHPDGIFWIRLPGKPGQPRLEQKIPLKDVAPTILQILGLKKPDYMTGRALKLSIGATCH